MRAIANVACLALLASWSACADEIVVDITVAPDLVYPVVLFRVIHEFSAVRAHLVIAAADDPDRRYVLRRIGSKPSYIAINLPAGRYFVAELVYDDKAFGFSRPSPRPVGGPHDWFEVAPDGTTYLGTIGIDRTGAASFHLNLPPLQAAEKSSPELFCCGRPLYGSSLRKPLVVIE